MLNDSADDCPCACNKSPTVESAEAAVDVATPNFDARLIALLMALLVLPNTVLSFENFCSASAAA